MSEIATKPWHPAEHFASEEDIVAYLDAALEDGTPGVFIAVLTDVARSAGLDRESHIGALSPSRNPDFVTVLKVLDAPGLQLHVEPERIRA